MSILTQRYESMHGEAMRVVVAIDLDNRGIR